MQGATYWTPQRLTWVANIMAWDEGQNLSARFENACVTARQTHRHRTLCTSYNGFADALERATPMLAEAPKRRFRREMLRNAGPCRERPRAWSFDSPPTTRRRPPAARRQARRRFFDAKGPGWVIIVVPRPFPTD